MMARLSIQQRMSPRALCPGPIVRLGAAFVEEWIPGTSPGMTFWIGLESACSKAEAAE